MTDILTPTSEIPQASLSSSEADIATGELDWPVGRRMGELAIESPSGEPLIQDPFELYEVMLTGGWFRHEIGRLLEQGTEMPRGSWHRAVCATNDLLQIDTQDETTATAILRNALNVTEELAKYAAPFGEVSEPTEQYEPIDAISADELPDGSALVSALNDWYKQSPKAEANLRMSVKWTRDAIKHDATEANLRDGAFLLQVTKELGLNSPS